MKTSKSRFHQLTHGPKLGDWVWVRHYIDFAPGQQELTRVTWDGETKEQYTLDGHWMGGKWAYTKVCLTFNNLKTNPFETPWHFVYLGNTGGGNDIWEARLIDRS